MYIESPDKKGEQIYEIYQYAKGGGVREIKAGDILKVKPSSDRSNANRKAIVIEYDKNDKSFIGGAVKVNLEGRNGTYLYAPNDLVKYAKGGGVGSEDELNVIKNCLNKYGFTEHQIIRKDSWYKDKKIPYWRVVGVNKEGVEYEYINEEIGIKITAKDICNGVKRYVEDYKIQYAKGGGVGQYRIIPYKRIEIAGSPDLIEPYYSLGFSVSGSLEEANAEAQEYVKTNSPEIVSATVTKIHPSGQPLKNKKVSYVTKDEITKYEHGGELFGAGGFAKGGDVGSFANKNIGKKVKVDFRKEEGIIVGGEGDFVTIEYPSLGFTEKVNPNLVNVTFVDNEYAHGGDIDEDTPDGIALAKTKGLMAQDFYDEAIEYVGGIEQWNKLTETEQHGIIIDMEKDWSRNTHFAKGGNVVDRNRLHGFLVDDLAKLKTAIETNDKEEIERFFSYWIGSSGHLQSLKNNKPSDSQNKRLYNFLEDDLKNLQVSIDEKDTAEIEKFFSYWTGSSGHLEALKYADGEKITLDINWHSFTISQLKQWMNQHGYHDITVELNKSKYINFKKDDYKKLSFDKSLDLRSGNENMYFDIVVRDDDNKEWTVSFFTKENREGLKLIAKSLINIYAKGGKIQKTTWGGTTGKLNIPMVSISKRNYNINVDTKTLEVDVNITGNDSVNHEALNNTQARWEQHHWGYMVYPKTLEQLYDVLHALKVVVSVKELEKQIPDAPRGVNAKQIAKLRKEYHELEQELNGIGGNYPSEDRADEIRERQEEITLMIPDEFNFANGGDVDDDFVVHGYYTVSNTGGYEVQISNSGDAARIRDNYGSDNPTISDWFEIEYVPISDDEEEEMQAVIDPQGYNIPLNQVIKINQ
jgi:hypothetical protein